MMNEVFIYTVVVLVAIGVVSAVVLYFVAQKFKVYEDPRIDGTEALLPGVNCGGCGYPGCRGLAGALVEQADISNLYCPVGGADVMSKVADYLGKSAAVAEPRVAVVRCGGSFCTSGCSVASSMPAMSSMSSIVKRAVPAPMVDSKVSYARKFTNRYDGAQSCAVISSLYGGPTDCRWGCLGCGDCVVVCNFDAIAINSETGLPEVNDVRCTACGACVKACPRNIIELRKRAPKERKIYVNCVSHDRGGVTRAACSAGCIGCGKCVKACPFGAIELKDNLAYIDATLCKFCRKCAVVCPTGAIVESNFPVKKATENV